MSETQPDAGSGSSVATSAPPPGGAPSKGTGARPPVPARSGWIYRMEQALKRRLGPKPIRRKFTAVTMLVCTVALVLSGVIFLACDAVSQVVAARASLASLAGVAAMNSRSSLDNDDPAAAAEKLNALMSYPNVTGIALYRADGSPFATPARSPDSKLPAQIGAVMQPGPRAGLARFQHFESVTDGAKRLGMVAVETNLSPLWSRLQNSALIAAIVLFLAAVSGRLLIGRLQAMVSEPIAELVGVAEAVVRENDYGLRAEKRNDDEVGSLAESFNGMLAEIQRRDEELGKAQLDLDSNVMARTSQLHQEVQDRRRTEEALKDSELRYRNLFENNPMPMLVMDLETLDFVAVNNAAIRHYGYRQDAFLLMSLPMITVGAEPLAVERAFRSDARSFDGGEWKHRKKNGEIIEVQLTAHAIVFAGKVTKIVLANDVTERNRAQRQVEEMHQQLVEKSRQAGMAEVATGVLHNVGNVLNSVNVSATILDDSIRKSKAANIRKVADLLEANKDDLAAFFAPGAKGAMLAGYLASLAGEFDSEQQSRLAEIEQLTKNISHIKDIVAMQQTYAKVTGVLENCAPRALLDEAVRLASADLTRSQTQVQIDCPGDLPQVCVDRHKLTQILVNLITNARQAMEDNPPGERRITVTASYHGGAMAGISIRDQGCGIPRENLTRIFNHGFTTKEGGHGFGLHSAANAAKEFGATLLGTSDGPGCGAVFTIQMPLKAPAAARKAA